ncbi:MAG: hypothetical protein ACR2L2_05545 [Acidobacteriota bacterium]
MPLSGFLRNLPSALRTVLAVGWLVTALRWWLDSFYLGVVWLIIPAALVIGWDAAGQPPVGSRVWNLSWRYALLSRIPVVVSALIRRSSPSGTRASMLAEELFWLLFTLYFASLVAIITAWFVRLGRRWRSPAPRNVE